MTIRVLIADDQEMIRSGLRFILEDQPDITVVAEAADGADAVAQARRVRPDVCLIDIRMPRLDGIEVTRSRRTLRPGPAPGDRGHQRPGHRQRPYQPGDRRRVVHLAEHGQEPSVRHPGQARSTQQGRIAAWAWENRIVT